MSSVEAVPASTLDRSQFTTPLKLQAIRVPAKKCQEYLKKLQGYTFNKPRMRCIFSDPESKDTRLLLLSEDLKDTGLEGLPEGLKKELGEQEVETTVPYELTLGYDYWTVDHVLKRLLPEGCEVPGSFETIGHIAHLNLRDELLPYRYIIGQVILDKNPVLKTVVNKLGNITNEFRVFDMEVVAGKKDLETEVRQFNCIFRLNFSEVYWNSRLEAEHKRLVDSFKATDTIVDMMAGIGPFAVPAALKGCTVFANDLNPRSVHYLRINTKRNKVEPKVRTYNTCGRKFARTLLRAPGTSVAEAGGPAEGTYEPPQGGLLFDHAVMNLPASAVEFLDAFNGAFDPRAWDGRELPMVHCYTFARSHETDADIQATCEKYLGGPMDSAPYIHNVRNVAPGKNMMCVSFRVPKNVAFAGRGRGDEQEGASAAEAEKRRSSHGENEGGAADPLIDNDDEASGSVAKKPRSEKA